MVVEPTWLAAVASLFPGGTGVMRDYYEGTPLVDCQFPSPRPTDVAVLCLAHAWSLPETTFLAVSGVAASIVSEQFSENLTDL